MGEKGSDDSTALPVTLLTMTPFGVSRDTICWAKTGTLNPKSVINALRRQSADIFITRDSIVVSTGTFALFSQKQGRGRGQAGLFTLILPQQRLWLFMIGGGLDIPPAQVVTLIFPSKRIKHIKREPPS